jgi:hypothetical protein
MYLSLCLFIKNSNVLFTYWHQYVDSNILFISVFYNLGLVDDTTYNSLQKCSEMSLHVFWNCMSVYFCILHFWFGLWYNL